MATRKLMTIAYSSNNSGGSWWLKDKDWKKLEAEGWTVDWHKERFLGALASRATKRFRSMKAAIAEFEDITGQDAEEEGCECCGRPHYFRVIN